MDEMNGGVGSVSVGKEYIEHLTIHAHNLDPIRVVSIDEAPGRGQITITCYGRAWTAGWGAMGARTVRDFFLQCDTDYLVCNLVRGMSPTLKAHRKSDEHYLARIVDAVRDGFVQLRAAAEIAKGVAKS